MSKRTIGANPLDAYLDNQTSVSKKKTEPHNVVGKKQRVTIHLDTQLINRVKDAVYWEPGLTLTDFTQAALQTALNTLERKRGSKYPERNKHNLKGGRPFRLD